MTADIDQPEAILCAYYDAVSAGRVEGIARFFDETVTLVTLGGRHTISGADHIESMYRTLLQTWEAHGLSARIGYDASQFTSRDVQSNVRIIDTRLTNYTKSGELYQSWNCTYVFCRTADGWKMSLATSDNETTATVS